VRWLVRFFVSDFYHKSVNHIFGRVNDYTSDGNNYILKTATRWDSKRRVMQQEKVFPIGVTRGNYRILGEA
jgi:hypothetical protein